MGAVHCTHLPSLIQPRLRPPAMGVPKLWEELEPAVKITSWAQLAAPAFERERLRGFRLGVDVAQWLLCMSLC